jgi:hypothetical protein
MMPLWCQQVNWGNCGIPWVNCTVYSVFPSGMMSNSKTAQFNCDCISLRHQSLTRCCFNWSIFIAEFYNYLILPSKTEQTELQKHTFPLFPHSSYVIILFYTLCTTVFLTQLQSAGNQFGMVTDWLPKLNTKHKRSCTCQRVKFKYQ